MVDPNRTITIILDRPAHGGNIGAVARAMKNMGLTRLRLVSPRQFPHQDAIDFAAGAVDILENSQRFSTLSDAVADLTFLVATTNRSRGQNQRTVTPRQLGEEIPEIQARAQTALGILFGTERTGLETIDVERADLLCTIPSVPEYGSLNLAQAVMVVAYEIRMGGLVDTPPITARHPHPRADAQQLERLFQHMQKTLTEIDFIKPGQHRHMMGSLKAMFHRAELDRREVSILRGILSEITAARERA